MQIVYSNVSCALNPCKSRNNQLGFFEWPNKILLIWSVNKTNPCWISPHSQVKSVTHRQWTVDLNGRWLSLPLFMQAAKCKKMNGMEWRRNRNWPRGATQKQQQLWWAMISYDESNQQPPLWLTNRWTHWHQTHLQDLPFHVRFADSIPSPSLRKVLWSVFTGTVYILLWLTWPWNEFRAS